MKTEIKSQENSEKALDRFTRLWREIADTAARRVGLSNFWEVDKDDKTFLQKISSCIYAKGGDVSARACAAELGKYYLFLSPEDRARFLQVLARHFGVSQEKLEKACRDFLECDETQDRLRMQESFRNALETPRKHLLSLFTSLPEGVKFVVDLRADLLKVRGGDMYLENFDREISDVLHAWFDFGFLDLERITWNTSAALLEKLIAYEAVHAIANWDDLRDRLDSDRRCYAFFHPRMPSEPLAFVEIALSKGIQTAIGDVLDVSAPSIDVHEVDSAIFYSISNTQKGLQGIPFGEYLIKAAVKRLQNEIPHVKNFYTLSPVPGFAKWLTSQPEQKIAPLIKKENLVTIREILYCEDLKSGFDKVIDSGGWSKAQKNSPLLQKTLKKLAMAYLASQKRDGSLRDPVARFHLRNGARLERINLFADTSGKGIKQSLGIMVNYRYIPEEMDSYHDAFKQNGKLIYSDSLRPSLQKSAIIGPGI